MICQGHGPTVPVVVTEGCGDHVALLMVFSLKQVRVIGFPQADPGMVGTLPMNNADLVLDPKQNPCSAVAANKFSDFAGYSRSLPASLIPGTVAAKCMLSGLNRR